MNDSQEATSPKRLHRWLGRRTAVIGVIVGVLVLVSIGIVGAVIGFSAKFTDISPDQSTGDASDPDAASGGRVNGLGRSSNGTDFYAASEWGGLFKSIDTGLTWQRLDNHLPVATWDIEVSPIDDNRVYATSFYDGRVDSLAGINVSVDGGNTWTHPGSATPPDGFCSDARRDEPSAFGISVDPDDSANVYIGTNCGLAVSNDQGGTWTYIDPTPGDLADDIWDVVVHDGGIIDLCGDDGHQRSVDGGTTWTTAAGFGLPSGRCSIAVSPDESYVLFVVAGNTPRESDDGGATWTNMVNPSFQGRIPFVATNQRTGTGFDLWFGDIRLHRASCTTPGIPGPGGATRCPSNTWAGPFTRSVGGHDDTGDISFNPLAPVDACPVMYSSDGGIYYNTLSASPACHSPAWEQPNVTPHALWLFAMAGADQPGSEAEDLYFGNQDTGTFASTTAGAEDPAVTNPRCCDGFDVVAESNRVLYTRCCFGGATRLFLRNPGMLGGGQVNNYPPGALRAFRNIESIALFGPGQYVVATSAGVYFTNNIAAAPSITWTQLGPNPPGAQCGVKVGVSAAGVPTFYVLSGSCRSVTQDQMYRYVGTAPGGNWQQVDPPGDTGGFNIYDVDPNDPNRIIASHLRTGQNPQMVLSTDGGTTWDTLPTLDNLMTAGGVFKYQTQRGPTRFTNFNGYPQPSLVAFSPTDQNVLVAGGMDSGIFVSVDGGVDWVLMSDPINPAGSGKPLIPRPRFAYFDHEDDIVNIYVGTQGRGVWRLTLEPDLVGTLTAPNITTVGEDIGPQLALEVTNQGGAMAAGSTVANSGAGYMVDLVLSSDTVVPSGYATYSPTWHEDVLLQGGRVSNTSDLGPGASQSYSVGGGAIPVDTPDGDYFLCVRVDPGDKVPELDEDNNVTCVAIQITLPDLIVTLAGPDTVVAGEDIGPQLALEVTNQGGAMAAGSTVANSGAGYMVDLVLSSDTVVPSGYATYSPTWHEDVLLQGGRVSNTSDLNPGASQSYSVGGGLPPDIVPPGYWVCARVDPGDVVPEENEDNNLYCYLMKVVEGG